MYIRSFRIDDFGIFSEVDVKELSPGLSIFLGRNEAGKSTCLDFLRAMLTGYPDSRGREARVGASPRSSQSGGTLELETARHGILRLTRRPGPGGGATTLLDSSGAPVDLAVLDRLLAGVTREVYTNVFGFSLSELQTFKSLDSEGVRHALYGASFGMGVRPPGMVLRQLDERMELLFKPDGNKAALNAAIKEWEILRRQMRAAEEESRLYDSKKMELAANDKKLADVRRTRAELEAERRQLEKKLGVWRQWDEWRKAAIRLERLGEVAESFPENGPARLERAIEIREEAARQCGLKREILERANEAAKSIVVDQQLLEALPEIRSLVERKLIFRNAMAAMPAKEMARAKAEQELQRQLTNLGPDWSCERIRATDRSLFAREELEQQASELSIAATAFTAANDTLQKANRMVENYEHAVQMAKAKADHLPMPVAALDDEGRDSMRRILGRIEENRQRIPERNQALTAARAAFLRSYTPLRLRPHSTPKTLDQLSESQEKATELSSEVQRRIMLAEDAARQVVQAQEAEEMARIRLERLKAQQKSGQGPGRAALDAKTAALRNLRNLIASQNMEMERKADLESRINGMWAPKPIRNLPLLFLGSAFILVGAVMLLANLKFGVTSFQLTSDVTLPVALWLGYLISLSGIGMAWGGMPRSGPEAERFHKESEELNMRLQGISKRVDELKEQIDEQSRTAGVDSIDPITLEATEFLLEREREMCVTEERLEQEMTALQAEYVSMREKTKRMETNRIEAETQVQQARRRWHEFLVSCNVDSVPAPEAVSAFFAKVESARLAAASVKALETEISDLENQIKEKENAARGIAPVAELLPADGGDLTSVLEAIRRVLDACREADAAAEERVKAAAEVRNAEINSERAAMAQGEAMDAIREAENRLGAAREAWRESLQNLGLGLELSPGTVREAFECMERCLSAEAEAARLSGELVHLREDCDTMIAPLRSILSAVSREVKMDDLLNVPDWLGTLDLLYNDALKMERNAAELARLQETVLSHEDELRAAESCLSDAVKTEAELLRQGGAGDAEEFLRLAAIREERKEIIRRREDLEDTLRLAADNIPFEEFIDSFYNFDREEGELRNARISGELETLIDEERALAATIAASEAALSNLAGTDHLSLLRQKEASLAESIQRMARDWSRLALARQLLGEAKRRFENERQPEVIRAASEIFSDITGQAWASVSASLEDSSLSVMSSHGESFLPDTLSRGAQEQLYLSLRLAYIRSHSAHASALPVIMDDILVNFDPERARRTASALIPLIKGNNGTDGYPAHQVLFFTCHPYISEMLKDMVEGSSVFMVEKGSIAPCL